MQSQKGKANKRTKCMQKAIKNNKVAHTTLFYFYIKN